MRSEPSSVSKAHLNDEAFPEPGAAGSEPIAFPRGIDISGGVSSQQQAVSDKCYGGGLDPSDIVFAATVAFFEREPGIGGTVALGSDASKRDQRTVAVA